MPNNKLYLTDGQEGLTGTITLNQQSGTEFTFETRGTYVDKDIILTLNAQSATPAFDGGELSIASSTVTSASNTVALSTTNNGIGIEISYSVDRASILYDGAVSGWVTAADNTTILSSDTISNTITRYITSINVPTSTTFPITNNGTLQVTSGSTSEGTVSIAAKITSTDGANTVENVVENGLWKTTNVISAGTYYGRTVVPSTTLTFTPGTISSNSASISSSNNITLNSSINNSGVSITCGGSITIDDTTYTNDIGLLDTAHTNEVITGTGINQTWNGTEYYINGVTLTAPTTGERTFSITVPDGNGTVTLVFHVDASGNVTVTE